MPAYTLPAIGLYDVLEKLPLLCRSGLKEEDMSKPQVGIASMWYEGNPCNMHLLRLAEEVKKGVVSL